MDFNIIITIITTIIALFSVVILAVTIKSNKSLNQKSIFNEIVKQERELRIKLSEYREKIHQRRNQDNKRSNWKEITLDYDTLLFNYYEYLAICIHEKFVNEFETKKYFLDLFKEVKQRFEDSILFKEEYAHKEQYRGILWLFKKWNI